VCACTCGSIGEGSCADLQIKILLVLLVYNVGVREEKEAGEQREHPGDASDPAHKADWLRQPKKEAARASRMKGEWRSTKEESTTMERYIQSGKGCITQ
jgi:hypothetical protein